MCSDTTPWTLRPSINEEQRTRCTPGCFRDLLGGGLIVASIASQLALLYQSQQAEIQHTARIQHTGSRPYTIHPHTWVMQRLAQPPSWRHTPPGEPPGNYRTLAGLPQWHLAQLAQRAEAGTPSGVPLAGGGGAGAGLGLLTVGRRSAKLEYHYWRGGNRGSLVEMRVWSIFC